VACVLVKLKVLLIVGGIVLIVAVLAVFLVVPCGGPSPQAPLTEHASTRDSGGDGGRERAPETSTQPQEDSLTPSADSYPIDLEKLRPLIPANVYWQIGAPTSDVAVAKERAARAEERNKMLGRIQANEASEEEIRAYYAERRRVSNDYLQLVKLVLEGKAGEVSERDRGLFEMTVNLHQGRLQQIERDQSDALGRVMARAARDGGGVPGAGGSGRNP
jgi:hypothetical protein